MIKIIVQKDDASNPENVITDGFLLLFMENDKIKMRGQMDIKALTPILTKILLEKITH